MFDQADVRQPEAPAEDRPNRFAPELSDRPFRFGSDRFSAAPDEEPEPDESRSTGLFGSGPERPEPIERPARPDRLGASGLFGSESRDRPGLFGSEERSGLFGVDAERSSISPDDERRDQPEPDDRFNRFRRFRPEPEPEPEPAQSPTAYQPPDRSDRYADERPGQPPTPGQVDFGRLRKFGRANEEAGSHRADAAPDWATSNTWDDQKQPEQEPPADKRKSRRARKAEPEQEQPPPRQWPAEPAAESQPAEKKSRRQQRRERKTRPDETEEWLSGLSSDEPMSWEARGPGRTAPNDSLGLTEDMAEIKRQSSRQRGSLFEDDGEETWNSPPPATDGDDWWEATPRRRRDGKD